MIWQMKNKLWISLIKIKIQFASPLIVIGTILSHSEAIFKSINKNQSIDNKNLDDFMTSENISQINDTGTYLYNKIKRIIMEER